MNGSMGAPTPSLEQQRERAIADLARHFANDGMSIEELERRIDEVQSAASSDALREAMGGIPAGPVAPRPAPAPPARPGARGVAGRSMVFALMGGTERRGGWTAARRIHAVAVMGGVELDFRDARLQPGITDVYVTGIMGGVTLIIPPDLPLEMSGMPIMGGWEEPGDARHPTVPGEPDEYHGELRLLRVRGFAFMGGVEVKVRLPGETGRDAARRRREQRHPGGVER